MKTDVNALLNPKIGEREAAEAMLRHDKRPIQPGQIIVGDKGFAGQEFEAFITNELPPLWRSSREIVDGARPSSRAISLTQAPLIRISAIRNRSSCSR